MRLKHFITALFAVVALSTLLNRAVYAGDGQFSNASLQGDYYCSSSGFDPVNYVNGDLLAYQFGVLIKAHYDGNGTFSNTATIINLFYGSQPCPFQPALGTYTINPDGTGSDASPANTATAGCPGGFEVQRTLIVEDGGNRFDFITREAASSGSCSRSK
jgi:hypothetical protein